MVAIEIGIGGKHKVSGSTEKKNQIIKTGVGLTPQTEQHLVPAKVCYWRVL